MNDQQQKYLELQSLEQQIQQLEQQLQVVQQQIAELTRLTESLDDFAKLTPNSPMLSMLGNGIYISSELKDTKQVVMNVGAGVSVKRTVPEAKKAVEKQIADLQKVLAQSQEHMQMATMKARELQTELMAEKAKEQGK